MGWKNWPSWLKGGIIGLIVEALIFLILSIRKCDYSEMAGGGGCQWGLGILFENLSHLFHEVIIVKIIALIILFAGFLIGAIIGWIVSKIKSRK